MARARRVSVKAKKQVIVQAVAVQPAALPATTGPGGVDGHVHPIAAAEAAESGIIWKQDNRGLWHARGVGGTYYAITKPSGVETLWQGTDGNQINLGTYDSLAGGFQAARRFLPHKEAAEVVPVLHAAEASEAATSTHMAGGIAWADYGRDAERSKKLVEWGNGVGKVDDPRKVYELVEPYFASKKVEEFLVIPLDVHGKPTMGISKVAQGQRSGVRVSPADVLAVPVQCGARSFIVVHNHPSGKAKPSDADKALTEAIKAATKPFEPDIKFDDHVIVSTEGYFSFEEGGLKKVR